MVSASDFSSNLTMASPRALPFKKNDFVLKGITPFYDKELGRGAYGKVYEVSYCKMTCAAKEIHAILVQDVGEAERRQTIESFLQECRQCSRLRHPNIIQFLGVYYPAEGDGVAVEMRLPVMVMEMMADSLTSFVKHKSIPFHIKYSIVHDVALGLCYLHNQDPPIVHRDLSPNNVLLTAHHVAKISDLGVAKVIKADSKKTMTKAPGTVDFMPPEALSTSPVYGPSMDVFSFAGIILHTFNQEWPSPVDQIEFDSKTREMTALSEVKRRQKHLDKMMGEAERLKPLVEECLDYDRTRRPTIEIVCERVQVMKDACRKDFPQEYIVLHQQNIQLRIVNQQLQDENAQLQDENAQLQATIKLMKSAKEALPAMPELSSSKHIKWIQLASLPVPLYYAHAVVQSCKIYVTGQSPRKGVENQVFAFDIGDNRWCELPPSNHSYGILHVIGGKLAIIGGRLITTNNRTKKVSTFDEGSQAWISYYPNLLSVRNRPGVASHLEYVIVAGGTTTAHNDSSSIVLRDIEVLNWEENSHWRRVSTKLPVPMYGFTPTVSDDHLLIVGYAGADRNRYRDACMIPVADIVASDYRQATVTEWTNLTVATHCGTTLVPNSSPPMIVGGEDSNNATTANIKVYDYPSKSWKNSNLLRSARSYAAVAAVPNGGIIVIGGCTKGGNTENWNSSSLKLVELGQVELLSN